MKTNMLLWLFFVVLGGFAAVMALRYGVSSVAARALIAACAFSAGAIICRAIIKAFTKRRGS